MDWAHDNIGISEKDMEKVFKYRPNNMCTVVRLGKPDTGVQVYPFATNQQLEKWMDTEFLPPSEMRPGLVLVLASRICKEKEPDACYGNDRKGIEKNISTPNSQITLDFAIKNGYSSNTQKEFLPSQGGSRKASILPFSRKTFESISQKLCIHGSIARVINRSDVPTFTRTQLYMTLPSNGLSLAYVYNCRTSNAWDLDLALTVTHFPRFNSTYAVLFGSSISTEKEVIRRLKYSGVEASYPMLLPGIFAELERDRHFMIFEKHMNNIEEEISELDYQPSAEQQIKATNDESRRKTKKSQWLDTLYLKNGLISWNAQLSKMASHTDELRNILIKPNEGEDWIKEDVECELQRRNMRSIGDKVNDRLLIIIEEYEEKIRECTMRIDGMMVATQWSHGETNVEIALATGRDSRYMRSIAVVTMVYLPGTFCSSIFSTQLFNWFPGKGDLVVSPYLWIYVLAAVMATILTLGGWYWVSCRKKRRKITSEDDLMA
ncbi:uncharacterized protein F4807DRAFT_407124, partial [Annulohypoxylon truncatum]|uniref:uncharacterized protein n=1 Tax=Annulohypoxylon truncatum TaxID=327061 RepID=UPI002008B825